MYTSIARLCSRECYRCAFFLCVTGSGSESCLKLLLLLKAPPRVSLRVTFVVLLSTRVFFLCSFHFRPSWNLIVEKKQKKGRDLYESYKKKTKKKGKKRHVKKSDQKIDTKSSSLLTCARLCTLGEAALATAKDDDDDDATTRARGGVKKLRGGLEEETPTARCRRREQKNALWSLRVVVVVLFVVEFCGRVRRHRV